MTESTLDAFDTLAVHAGDAPDPSSGALDPPVVLSTAFAFDDAADAAHRFATGVGLVYSRWRNPTVMALEGKLAALEGGEACAVFASGMGAVHAALGSCVSAGDEVVVVSGLYAETLRLLRGPLAKFGVTMRHARPDAVEVSERTRAVYLETPANPTLAVTDIEAVAAQKGGAPLLVDSTFATPYHQLPLSLGADLVVHSATKGLCGHGDAIGGAVIGASPPVEEARAFGVRSCGAALSPMNAMLISRGARTLGLRMAKASANAQVLAERLEAHRAVARVYYPGLWSHPDHAIAARQMIRGFGALIAFEVAGGVAAGAAVYDRVETITRAVSLGDARTLLTHPASTTHHSLTAEERAAAGISDGLMRLSVGIEDVEDLWRDLERALGGPS